MLSLEYLLSYAGRTGRNIRKRGLTRSMKGKNRMHAAVMIVCGLCMAASFYLVYLGYQTGEGIPWLFAAFGALFGIPFLNGLLKILGRKMTFPQRADKKLSREQVPRTTFVPHWFMMTAVIVALILILAAIIIPMIARR